MADQDDESDQRQEERRDRDQLAQQQMQPRENANRDWLDDEDGERNYYYAG